MALVSVIIPTHNRAHTLVRALNSVQAQTFTDWELIVVDDGSTDGTEALINEWSQSTETRVKYIQTAHADALDSAPKGVSVARNLGARSATGEWLAFLDSDDAWMPKKLELQLSFSNDARSSEKGTWNLIHGEEIWIRNGVRVNPMRKHAKSGGRIFSRCVELCCISPSASLVTREVFESLNGFREDFPVCEDYELWLRLCARYEVGFINTPIVQKYGGHNDQLSRKFKAMDYFRVKALFPFLISRDLTQEERDHVAHSILFRCSILRDGLEKHGSGAFLAFGVDAHHASQEIDLWRRAAGDSLNETKPSHSETGPSVRC